MSRSGRRAFRQQLAYVAGSLTVSGLTTGVETTLLDNVSFTVTSAGSLVSLIVRMACQVDVTVNGRGLASAAARIDSAGGSTQSGTRVRLSGSRVQVDNELAVVAGAAADIVGLAAGTHTIKITVTSEQPADLYCRATSTEFIEIDVTEVLA